MNKLRLLRIFTVLAALTAWPWAGPVSAQWMEMWSVEGHPKFIRIDNIHHLYAVGETEIIKYDDRGNAKYRFSNNQYGSIGDVDVSQPLRPLVFYPDLGALLLLDNTLSEFRGPIDLGEKGIVRPLLACASVQNHFWVYDQIGSKLVRLSDRFDKVVETGNLAQILGIALEPEFIRETDGRVYLNDPAVGILVFDLFGSYVKTIPIKNLRHFNFVQGRIVYLENDSLRQYHTMTHDLESTALPLSCRYVTVAIPHVAAVCGKNIHFWKWTEEE